MKDGVIGHFRARLSDWTLTPFVVSWGSVPALQHVAPTPLMFGQSLSVLTILVGSALSVLLLLVSPRIVRADRLVTMLLWLLVVGSVYGLFREALSGQTLAYTAFTVPAVGLTLLVKQPTARAAWLAAWSLTWVLLSSILLTSILDVLVSDVAPRWGFVVRLPGIYWELIAGERWYGPFSNANLAAFALAPLAVFLIATQKHYSVAIAIVVCVGLLATGSRMALVAVVVASIVGVWHSRNLGRITRRLGIWQWSGVLLVVTFLLIYLSWDSWMQRQAIWAFHWSLFLDSPVWGLGTAGNIEAWTSVQKIPLDVHGHNLVLDSLSRFGLTGLAVLTGTGVISGAIAWRSFRNQWDLPMAMLTLVALVGLTDRPITWLEVAPIGLMTGLLLLTGQGKPRALAVSD